MWGLDEKWSDTGYVLKAELTEGADCLDVRFKTKR